MARVYSYEERGEGLVGLQKELEALVKEHSILSARVEEMRKAGQPESVVEAFAQLRLDELEDRVDILGAALSAVDWVHQVTLQIGCPEAFKFAVLKNTNTNGATVTGDSFPYGENMATLRASDQGAALGVDSADQLNLNAVFDEGDTVAIIKAEDKENLSTLVVGELPEHVKDAQCAYDATAGTYWAAGAQWAQAGSTWTCADVTAGTSADRLLVPVLTYLLEYGHCYKLVVAGTFTSSKITVAIIDSVVGTKYVSFDITAAGSYYFQCPYTHGRLGITADDYLMSGGSVALDSFSVKACDLLVFAGATNADNDNPPAGVYVDSHIIPVENAEDKKLLLVLKDR